MVQRDPNVQLPKSVRDKVAQGENIFREAYGQPLNPELDPNDLAPPSDPPVRPPLQGETTQNDLSEVRDDAPEPQPPTTPPAPNTWEQRYKTLEGRAKADAATHRKQISDLNKRIEEQTQALMEGSRVIATMQDQIRQLQAAPPPPPAPARPVEIDFQLTPEEREQWSPEFLNIVKRAAGAVVSTQIAAKDQEINNLRAELTLLGKQVKDVGATNAQTSLATFLANMSLALPGWEEQNEDDDFLAWLNGPDGFSGQTLKNSLDTAVASRNVGAAVRIFQGYRASQQASNPTPPAPTPPPNGGGRVRLDSLAAPRSTRQQPQTEQEAPLPPSPAEISKFTADVTKGKYKGRDAERVAFQKRIDELARRSIQVATRGNPY